MVKQNRETNGRLVRIKTDKATIEGSLTLPKSPIEIVLFAHGSGSSRFSSRNQYVARALNQAGIATLLIDLLTSEATMPLRVFTLSRFVTGLKEDSRT